jgi:hypothetical protein
MERIPLSIGYRRELTWRFRLGLLALFLFVVAREYLRHRLQLELHRIPLEAIWNPPHRIDTKDAVALVEFLNYCYAFLFVLWIRDGVVLSFDFIGLKLRDALRSLKPRRQAFGHS